MSLRDVREQAGRVEEHSDHGAEDAVASVAFDELHQVAVERIFGGHEGKAHGRRDGVIHPAAGVFGATDVPDRGFTERAELELDAVDGHPRAGLAQLGPVPLGQREILAGDTGGVAVEVTGRGAMDRVADVVDEPAIAVLPVGRNAD